jgi:hypothetical protein
LLCSLAWGSPQKRTGVSNCCRKNLSLTFLEFPLIDDL